MSMNIFEALNYYYYLIVATSLLIATKTYSIYCSLALQILGLYKELWLSGAVTPARRSNDLRLSNY